MIATATCTECGRTIPTGRLGRFCNRCMLSLAFESATGYADSDLRLAEVLRETDEPESAGQSGGPGPGRRGFCRPEDLTEKPGDRIGRYRLLQQIGQGGFGVVYLAEQDQPVKRRVALKIIKLGMDTREVVARFEAERQALAVMEHPNIAKVLDAGSTATGRPYFVMELVKGVKITSYCEQEKVRLRERLRLFMQVCCAIQHAHQKGIIHRDIKPSNVLVSFVDGAPVPRIIDFGIAKATQHELTEQTVFTERGQFMGTPAYMSPEQADMGSLDIDTRSDIYSLGVLLYELLTGTTPFDSAELASSGLESMRRTIRETEPLRPSTRLGTMKPADLARIARGHGLEPRRLEFLVRGDLDWIAMKCLEKDRNRRYETANDLAADLERYLDQEPVLARPPSNIYRLQKLVRRNKIVFASAGAVACALVLGLGFSTFSWLEERAARKRAVTAEGQAQRARLNESRLRQQAEADRRTAQTEAAKSQQVARLLQDAFKGVGPSKAMGRDTVMLREILDDTATRVGSELKDAPEVEAELRATLGQVYQGLGVLDTAEQMQQRALALRKTLFGAEAPAVASSLNDLANVMSEKGSLPQAESLHREALAMRRKLLGEKSVDTAQSLNGLGMVLYDEGKLDEAEKSYREALALRRELLGPDRSEVADTLSNLGALSEMQGRLDEAESLHRQALALRRKLFGNDNLAVAESLNNLGAVLRRKGNFAEVESVQREILGTLRKLLGPRHPLVALSMSNLAFVLHQRGELAEAESLGREALAMRRELLGPEHPFVALSLNNLANVLRQERKLEEAEAMHREALAMRTKLLGPSHRYVGASLDNLALVLHDEGNLAEAESLERQALLVYQKAFSKGGAELAIPLYNLAVLLREEGNLADAEAVGRQCLDINERFGPDNWPAFSARAMLGQILVAEQNYADAEPLLLSGHDGLMQRDEMIPSGSKPSYRKLLDSIATLFEATHRPELAINCRQLSDMNRAGTTSVLP